MSEPGDNVVRLHDESIKLGQFLKLSDLVDTGADAKGLLAQGLVRVNGDVETRRGRQLVAGDVVECAGRRVVVSTSSTGD
jgi:ribosome-associated protein